MKNLLFPYEKDFILLIGKKLTIDEFNDYVYFIYQRYCHQIYNQSGFLGTLFDFTTIPFSPETLEEYIIDEKSSKFSADIIFYEPSDYILVVTFKYFPKSKKLKVLSVNIES